ncbi:MAG: EAL domain-containing protein [Sphingomicrobium sp.]
MPSRDTVKSEQSPLRLLLWTAILGLIFGLVGFGELPEDLLRASRNSLHPHQASGDIVVVEVGDRSLRDVSRWPWPRRYHAQLTDELTRAGASRIFFDVMFEGASTPAEDRLFADAIKRSGKVTLAVRAQSGFDGASPHAMPLPMFTRDAEIGTISAFYNYQNAVWRLPFSARIGDRDVPSFAAKLAGVTRPAGREFLLDYSLDPTTVPAVSAASVLDGSAGAQMFAGKSVIIAGTSDVIGDQYFLPGWGKMGGVYVQVTGAETLKSGIPVAIGWFPAFLVALALLSLILRRKTALAQNLLLGAATLTLLLGPALLEANLIFADVTPALFVVILVASVLTYRRFRTRGLVNAVSGLPNLLALRGYRPGRSQALIVARVLNYAEIIATLPSEGERQLVEQVVARLSVGAAGRTLYQGDDGIFAWFEEGRLPFGNHIEALYALFRNPARISGKPIDLTVAFGVEIGSGRSLANRLASALVAAEEAAHTGLKWKCHDPETLADAAWRLSMLSQLDGAIDKGEVWVAYQPKLDLATSRIIGAEALARWTHPEKGPIAASEFVAAAEQHDRIAKLTDFVLDQAIAAAAEINQRHPGFEMAVNLSARLLSDPGFTLRLTATLARHGLPPRNLILELTETAELTSGGAAVDMLVALRELGVTISIDDYGTGLSTLDYLKKIPATEIKIDQSFVKAMLDNRSDMVMVQSTIALAHSLGRRVVAEGVEQRETLDVLIAMKCDVAQGYVIGRPMSLESLAKRLPTSSRSKSAQT